MFRSRKINRRYDVRVEKSFPKEKHHPNVVAEPKGHRVQRADGSQRLLYPGYALNGQEGMV